MSRGQRPGGDGGRSGRPLRQALDDPATVPRRQGPALRYGLWSTRIGEPMRRDRLLLVSPFAEALMALLGTVGERLGMDWLVKFNQHDLRPPDVSLGLHPIQAEFHHVRAPVRPVC